MGANGSTRASRRNSTSGDASRCVTPHKTWPCSPAVRSPARRWSLPALRSCFQPSSAPANRPRLLAVAQLHSFRSTTTLMMNWIVSTSLNLRIAVVASAIILMIVGIQIVRTTPLDVFPEFAPPLVEIQTEAPGLSTAEVESLVSAPIENSLNGMIALKTLRSKSVLGLSSVVIIFEEDTDLMRARQLVQERLAIVAAQLPTVAHPPVILSPLSSTSRVMKIGVSSAKLSQMELTTLARWTIRPRLMAISGVANVAIWGERDRQLQVLVDPDNLRAHNVTLDDVLRTTRDAVAPAAGGFIDTPNQRFAVTHVSTISQAEDLERIPVTFRDGSPLRLGDVA